MHNEYKIMMTLTGTLNESESIVNEIISKNKDEFANDDKLINIAMGLVAETNKIIESLPSDFYTLNPKLSNSFMCIKKYSKTMLNKYSLVNAHKLYDFIKLEICELKNYLNSVNN